MWVKCPWFRASSRVVRTLAFATQARLRITPPSLSAITYRRSILRPRTTKRYWENSQLEWAQWCARVGLIYFATPVFLLRLLLFLAGFSRFLAIFMSFKYIFSTFLVYFWHTFRAFLGLRKMPQKCPKSVPKVCQKCAKSVLKMY